MRNLKQDVRKLETTILECNGAPRGKELPQVASADDVAIALLHKRTGIPLDAADIALNNQEDPSYNKPH